MPDSDCPLSLPTARFNHAAINCNDKDQSVRFYSQVLGFREVPRPAFSFVGSWLYRDGLGMMLHLIQTDAIDPPLAGPAVEQAEADAAINSRIRHLAFRVTDVDLALERLDAHGVEYVAKRLPTYGYRQVFFKDPDGNLIEVGEWPDVEQMPLEE